MLQRISHAIHHGRDSGKELIVNVRRVSTTAVCRMCRAGRNSDRSGASHADLPEMIRRTAVGDDRFDFFAVPRIGHHSAATHYDPGDALDDHRRHHNEGDRRGIDVFER